MSRVGFADAWRERAGGPQYVKYFPRGERYVSLLRDADDPAGQARLEAERARLRALVRRQVADLAMLTQPDEGVGAAASLPGPTVPPILGLPYASHDATVVP